LPGAYFHRTISESFFILNGTVRLLNGEKWIDAQEGDSLHVPRGGLHAFRDDSDTRRNAAALHAGRSRHDALRSCAASGPRWIRCPIPGGSGVTPWQSEFATLGDQVS
jgi:uncharacterized cupin superfamily protein